MTYPLLSKEDLVANYSEEYPALNIRDDDFTNPQMQRWLNIYMTVLSLITDTDVATLKLRHFKAVEHVEYMDIHQDGLMLNVLAKCLHRVLMPAGIQNFSVKDISAPTPKRLRSVMSAVLNYLRYKIATYDDFQRIQNRIQQRVDQHEDLKKKNDECLRRINLLRATQAEQEPKLAKAKAEKDAAETRLHELRKQAAQLEKTGEDLKSKIADTTKSLTTVHSDCETKRQERDHLDMLIVHSPKRAAEEQLIMEDHLVQLKAVKEDKVRRMAEVKKALSLQRTVEGQQACQLMQNIWTATERERELLAEKKRLQNEQQQRQAELVDADARLQMLQRNSAMQHEKLEKLVLQQRVKEDSVRRQIQDLQAMIGRLDIEQE